MTATDIPLDTHQATRSLRLLIGAIGIAFIGLAMLWAASTLMDTVDQGDFKYAGDYWLTAAALPLGVGLALHALLIHHLQGGRDGRLGVIGTGIYVLCNVELIVQCMASIAVGAELRWGPTYVLSTLGTFVGLILIAAASWRSGLLPRWMLGIWPPLGLLGSWFGTGPIPLLFGLFLAGTGVLVHRSLSRAS